MNVRRVAVGLVIVGVLCLLWAMNMETTYEGVYNLHMGNRQQSLLIFGGFLFLGGIVLFALFKVKQTPEQERDEQIARDALRAGAGQQVESATQPTSSVGQRIKLWWLGNPAAESASHRSGIALKLLAGIPLSLMFGHAISNAILSIRVAGTDVSELDDASYDNVISAYDDFFPILLVVAIGALIYTLRSKRLARVGLQLSSISAVAMLLDLFTDDGFGLFWEVLAPVVGGVFVVSTLVLRKGISTA